jgi:cytochrome c553
MSTAINASPRYTDLRRIEPIHGDVQAGAQKAAACTACHGADGTSVAPTFPRLAGQRVDYLYHRLFSFRHADPKDAYYSTSPMTSIAAGLSDVDMRDLAAYFAGQTPRSPDTPSPSATPIIPATPSGPATPDAPGTLSAPATPSAAASTRTGEMLFLHGDPTRGVPPCQGCHGADANGPSRVSDQYAAYPALRGQYAPYVASRLTNFRRGQPTDTSNAFIMQGVAATLDDASIQTVADWLSSMTVRPGPARAPGATGSARR